MRIFASAIVAVLVFAGLSGVANAQYPDRTIRVIVPFGAGGSADVAARLFVDKLAARLNVAVTVENRPGAGGNIGAGEVARAKPDGYTLLLSGPTSLSISRTMKDTPFKYPDDFAPISQAVASSYVLMARPELPVKTFKDLIQYSKNNRLLIGVAAIGSGNHLSIEDLKAVTGLAAVSVNYPGNAAVMTALLGGVVHMSLDAATIGKSQADDGKVKILAVTSLQRSPLLPDVPTVAESGYPGFEVGFTLGFFAPKGTPDVIVDKLSGEFAAIAKFPDLREKLNALGFDPVGSSPQDFKKHIDTEVVRVIKTIDELRAQGVLQQ